MRPLRAAYVLGAGGATLAMLWLGYAIGGHWAVTAAYAQAAPTGLARLLPIRADMPLDYNLARADAVFFTAYRILAGLWTLGVAVGFWRAGRLIPRRPKRGHVLALAGGLLLLLGPTPWMKCIGLLLALQGPGMAATPSPVVTIRASRVRLALTAAMALAFLAAPYWSTVPSVGGQIAGLVLLMAATLAWSWAAAGPIVWRPPAPDRWRDAAWIALIVIVVNGRALGADIPWWGDEDYHIMQIVHLCETMAPVWVLTVGVIVGLVAWGRLEHPGDARGLTLAVLAVAVVGGAAHPHLDGSVLRYPYFTRWLQGALVQGVYPWGTLFFREAHFRLVPLLSAVAFGALAAAQLSAAPRHLRVAFGALMVTIPTVLYYTTTLALEMPALVAMTIVGFAAGTLLRASPAEVRSHPAWLALLAVGFIKETVVPLLAAYAGCRLLLAARHWRSPRAWWEEARLLAAVLAPLALYILYRRWGGVFREYEAARHQVFDLELWRTLGQSGWEQFGPLALLALPGLVIGWRRRGGGASVLLAVAIAAAGALFFIVDDARYVGYSRYNLVLLPAVFVAATWAFAWVAARAPRAALLLAALLAGAHYQLSPLLGDGAKRPGWGGSAGDVAEKYYPYRETLGALHATHRDTPIFFAGLGYPYYLDFYMRRFDWQPAGQVALGPFTPSEARRAASAAACTLVVYPLPTEADMDDVQALRVFRNQAHAIAILEVDSPGTSGP